MEEEWVLWALDWKAVPVSVVEWVQGQGVR